MPRSKPDSVVTHRIELGGWERERYKNAEMVAAGAILLPAAGIAAVGIGGAMAAYALYQWLKDGPFTGIIDTLTQPAFTEEQREKFRSENPSLLSQAFGGPSLLWNVMFGDKE